MIVDLKLRPATPMASQPEASTSERKLSIELPSPRQIYTAGTTVTGLVHLGSKEPERIQVVQVSLVCVVRSMHHRYLGGSSHDVRRETTKLIHRDRTLWTASEDLSVPPADMPFEIIIPDVGNDRRAKDPNAALPPSFHAGRRRGWRNMMTYGTPIGFIKYYVKVSVARKGTFLRKERAFHPLVFLPPSPPPPILPSLPDPISNEELDLPEDRWCSDDATTSLRHRILNSCGEAQLSLWLPRLPSIPRLTPIPFVLCLVLKTREAEEPANGEPAENMLPPAPQLDKASVHLRQTIRSCARGGRQTHTSTLDATPTDNILYGVVPDEGTWKQKTANDGRRGVAHWEKQFTWRGLWMFKETPNFTNRQLSWEYALVAEIPIKGLGNDVKLVSRPIEVSSGVAVGAIFTPSSEEDMLDLPPDYFENDDSANDDDGEKDEKDEK